MGKMIFVVLIGVVVWLLFFFKPSRPRRDRADAPPGAPEPGVESMVQCARCGVFMPRTDSVVRDGKIGCAHPQQCRHTGESRN